MFTRDSTLGLLVEYLHAWAIATRCSRLAPGSTRRAAGADPAATRRVVIITQLNSVTVMTIGNWI